MSYDDLWATVLTQSDVLWRLMGYGLNTVWCSMTTYGLRSEHRLMFYDDSKQQEDTDLTTLPENDSFILFLIVIM